MASGQEPRGTDTRAHPGGGGEAVRPRGFDATSVRDVAGEIGISNPSLYHHFSSKGAILDQLLAEPLARLQRALQEAAALSGEARARRIITGLLEALEVHHGVRSQPCDNSGAPT